RGERPRGLAEGDGAARPELDDDHPGARHDGAVLGAPHLVAEVEARATDALDPRVDLDVAGVAERVREGEGLRARDAADDLAGEAIGRVCEGGPARPLAVAGEAAGRDRAREAYLVTSDWEADADARLHAWPRPLPLAPELRGSRPRWPISGVSGLSTQRSAATTVPLGRKVQ